VVDVEATLKVLVVGNGEVGKTSLITRYASGAMTDQYKKTLGTDFCEKDCQTKLGHVKLHLWDTAGQEMFAKLTRGYYRGAAAVIYAFSTTDRASFLEIENWKKRVEEICGPIVSVLIQNKTDLIADAKMTTAEAEDLARRIGVKLYRTCVKSNLLVSEVFEYLAEEWLKSGGDKAADPSMPITGGSAEHKAAAAATNGDGKAADGSATSNGATTGTAATPTATAGPDAPKEPTKSFPLEPSTKRTDGKKSGCNCS